MILERFITPGMGVNLYLVGAGKQVIMIDPGTIIPKVDELIEACGEYLDRRRADIAAGGGR